MGVALSLLSGGLKVHGKIFLGHQLLDAKGILEKYETLVVFLSNFNFCPKIGRGLATPLWPSMSEKIKIF